MSVTNADDADGDSPTMHTNPERYLPKAEILTEATCTDARVRRAVDEDMRVIAIGADIYEVLSSSGSDYQVELGSGFCECPDAMNRGPGCKHAIKCALATARFDVERVLKTADEVEYHGERRAVLALGEDVLPGVEGTHVLLTPPAGAEGDEVRRRVLYGDTVQRALAKGAMTVVRDDE